MTPSDVGESQLGHVISFTAAVAELALIVQAFNWVIYRIYNIL